MSTTTKAAHTPGAWDFTHARAFDEVSKPEFSARVFSRDPGPEHQFTVGFVYHPDQPTREANAHLIAAAPELLAVLERCLESQDCNGYIGWKTCEEAEAIIQKAKGGQ